MSLLSSHTDGRNGTPAANNIAKKNLTFGFQFDFLKVWDHHSLEASTINFVNRLLSLQPLFQELRLNTIS